MGATEATEADAELDVAITGAASTVGRAVLPAFERAPAVTATALTHREREGIDSELLEVTDPEDTAAKLAGYDVVVHLAAMSDPDDPWEAVLPVNVEGTYNVYEAAVAGGVDRVLFASTNHVVQMYNADDPAEPESLVADPEAIGTDAVPRPDSYYAVSKVFGEALGSYYVDRHRLEVVNLRIGWLDSEALRSAVEAGGALARYARAMYLSERDCRDALTKAATASLPENPLTVNVLSENAERYLAITETMRTLGYDPRDDAADVFG
jgi:L-arabinose 1-dehydrogenase [NAD(P)+]